MDLIRSQTYTSNVRDLQYNLRKLIIKHCISPQKPYPTAPITANAATVSKSWVLLCCRDGKEAHPGISGQGAPISVTSHYAH